MRMLKDKKLAIFFSIGLHVIIFSLLFIKLPHSHPRLAKNVNVIQAVAVSEPTQAKSQKEPSHVPMLTENTIRHIEQTALKQTESTPVPISKPLPAQPTPPPVEDLPPVKKPVEVKEPAPIQEPKIDERAQLIAKQKVAEEKKRVEQQKKEELKRQEAELTKQRKAEEAKQLQKELAAENKQEESKASEESDANDDANDDEAETKEAKGDSSATTKTAAADTSGELDKYKQMIIQSISRKWIVPEAVAENVACQLLVHLGPGGVVISVDVLKESGDANLDRSARNAIMKASPLPVPESADLFDNFRALRLTFRPEGIVSG